MDGQYMLLSNVPQTKQQASTIKKKFGKLTLATITKDEAAVRSVVTSQRRLYFEADEDLLTDDEDEGQEKENQIFNTQPERDLVTVMLKSKRESEQSTESVEFQMAKLEISQSQRHLTDDQKSSQVLFGTESAGDQDGSPAKGVVKQEFAHADEDQEEPPNGNINYSIVSIVTISSTNTSGIIDPPAAEVVISDDEGEEEDSIEKVDNDPIEDENPRISEETRLSPSNDEDDDELSHFSGTLPSKCSEPNCSAPDGNSHPESMITSSVMRKLSDFFNKIPDLDEPESPIDLTISETPPLSPSPNGTLDKTSASLPETVDNEDYGEAEVIENSQEDIIPLMTPTPAKRFTPLRSQGPAATNSTPSSTRAGKKQKGSQEINIRTQVGGEKEEVINISAKIKVNIVIRTQEASSSEDEPSPRKDEKPIIVVKDEEPSPHGGSIENRSLDQEGSDPTPLPNHSNSGENGQRRTSKEIAEMDTQSNSPPSNLNPVAFRRFEDTPKGKRDTPKGSQQIALDRQIAEMDTEINSTVDSFNKIALTEARNVSVAELDTVCDSPGKDVADNQQIQSNGTANMDTEVNTEPVEGEKVNSSGLDSIELDDASIAILNSVYGSEWRTPQLLKSIKRTTTSAEMSFQPNMTDFQKFNANVQRDLESTRMENRGSMKKPPPPPPSGGVQRAKSVEEAPNTPLTVFKTASVVHSPYFSNKKALPVAPSRKPLRTPLKATPKYKKILQVVDTDSSDDEEQAISVQSSSDESYKAGSASEDSSGSSASGASDASSNDKKGRRVRGGGGGGATKKQKSKSKSTSRKGFDFTQIASSDSELDDTIFIDRDAVPKPIKEERGAPTTVVEGGKRKLFSDLTQHTPTSDSGEEREARGSSTKDDQLKVAKERELRFPWLHQFTPINKVVAGIKRTEVATPPRSVGKCGFLSSLDGKIGKAIAHPEAVVYRELYRQKKEELAQKLFKLYDEQVFGGALAQVPIKWNKKLLTTAGRCINMGKMGKRSAEVELSEKVLTSADRLRCTLIHELCHAAAWIVDAEKKGHAGHWKRWTERAVQALPELPKITVRHDYNIEYKYTYQCTKCAAKTQMHSKTKKAENIRCRFCHGDIEILLNRKTKAGEVVKTPVRAASGFALFVKENYKKLKQPTLKHAEVMKLLSQNFADLKVQKNDEDVL